MWPSDRKKYERKIEEMGWTIVGLKQEIASLKADKADRVYQSAESKHVYRAVVAMNEAFKPIEAGGYTAWHMKEAMQQSRTAIMALAAWTARADNLEGRK